MRDAEIIFKNKLEIIPLVNPLNKLIEGIKKYECKISAVPGTEQELNKYQGMNE